MARIARRIAIGVAALALLAVLLPFLIPVSRLRPMIESELSKTLGRPVGIGSVRLSLFSGGVAASNLSIADDPAFGSEPFVTARSMKIGADLWLFLRKRRLNVTSVSIEQPEIALRQSLSGDWNFSRLAASIPLSATQSRRPKIELSIQLVKIAGGRLSVKLSACPNVLRMKQVSLELRNFSSTASFPFSLTGLIAGGGEINLHGKAGPLDRNDVALTPLDADLKLTGLNLTASGLVGPTSGLAGLLSFDGAAGSDGRTLQLSGRLQAEQLKLARNGVPARPAARLDFALGHNLRTRAGAIGRGDVRLGAAQASLTGTYVIRGDSTVVNLNFYGPNMAVPDLAGMLPALGIVLPAGASFQGGAAGARLAVEGPSERLVASGALAVGNTRLAGFDLASKMSPVVRLAGIQAGASTLIQSLASNLRIAPEGIAVTNIRILAPSIGTITGAGTISPSHALNFTMRADIQNAGGIIGILGPLGGLGAVPFFILGSASNPIFEPDLNGLANEKAKTMQDMGTEVVKHASDIFSGLMDQLKPR